MSTSNNTSTAQTEAHNIPSEPAMNQPGTKCPRCQYVSVKMIHGPGWKPNYQAKQYQSWWNQCVNPDCATEMFGGEIKYLDGTKDPRSDDEFLQFMELLDNVCEEKKAPLVDTATAQAMWQRGKTFQSQWRDPTANALKSIQGSCVGFKLTEQETLMVCLGFLSKHPDFLPDEGNGWIDDLHENYTNLVERNQTHQKAAETQSKKDKIEAISKLMEITSLVKDKETGIYTIEGTI